MAHHRLQLSCSWRTPLMGVFFVTMLLLLQAGCHYLRTPGGGSAQEIPAPRTDNFIHQSDLVKNNPPGNSRRLSQQFVRPHTQTTTSQQSGVTDWKSPESQVYSLPGSVDVQRLTDHHGGVQLTLQPSYTLVPIDQTGTANHGSKAYGINDFAEVVGEARVGPFTHAFLYSRGDFDILRQVKQISDSSVAIDINNQGHILGWYSSQNCLRSFLFRGHQLTPLPLLKGANFGKVTSINEAGLVVGYAGQLDPEGGEKQTYGFLCGYSRTLPLWLPKPPLRMGRNRIVGGVKLIDVNNTGVVCGEVLLLDITKYGELETTSRKARAYICDPNGWKVMLPCLPGGSYSQANAINTHGTSVGEADNSEAKRRAVIFLNEKTHELGVLPGDWESSALDINDDRIAVGWSRGPSGKRAVLFTSDGPRDLNQLVSNLGQWRIIEGRAINSHGDIAANGVRVTGGSPQALLLKATRSKQIHYSIPAGSTSAPIRAVDLNDGQLMETATGSISNFVEIPPHQGRFDYRAGSNMQLPAYETVDYPQSHPMIPRRQRRQHHLPYSGHSPEHPQETSPQVPQMLLNRNRTLLPITELERNPDRFRGAPNQERNTKRIGQESVTHPNCTGTDPSFHSTNSFPSGPPSPHSVEWELPPLDSFEVPSLPQWLRSACPGALSISNPVVRSE